MRNARHRGLGRGEAKGLGGCVCVCVCVQGSGVRRKDKYFRGRVADQDENKM